MGSYEPLATLLTRKKLKWKHRLAVQCQIMSTHVWCKCDYTCKVYEWILSKHINVVYMQIHIVVYRVHTLTHGSYSILLNLVLLLKYSHVFTRRILMYLKLKVYVINWDHTYRTWGFSSWTIAAKSKPSLPYLNYKLVTEHEGKDLSSWDRVVESFKIQFLTAPYSLM